MSDRSVDGLLIGRIVRGDAAGLANARIQRAKSGAYAAIASRLAMGVIGALGLVANQPWLFPSLGPTIFLQAVTPGAPSARLRNTIAGHAFGVCAGFASLFLFGAQTMPAVMSAEVLSVERVAATALSVAVTVGVQSLLKVQHPPAAATTMLITLGGLKHGLVDHGRSSTRFRPRQNCPNLASGQPIASIALPGGCPSDRLALPDDHWRNFDFLNDGLAVRLRPFVLSLPLRISIWNPPTEPARFYRPYNLDASKN